MPAIKTTACFFWSAPVPPNTFDLVSSVPAILSVHAGIDVVLDDATLGVTAWLDRTGNARNYNNLGAPATLPLWSVNGGPGGRGRVSGDGVARFIANTNWNPPAPGTTPMYWRAIARQNAWANGGNLWCGATASRLCFVGTTSTPRVSIRNTTVSTLVDMVLGTWYRVEAYYSNSTSDLLKVGGTSVTGVNVGNNDQAVHGLFGTSAGTNLGNFSIAKLEIFAGLPTNGERAAMDASDQDYFGLGNVSF